MSANRKIIEVLNRNLNMELSLTSRELYHSNFIAYMIKNNPDVPLMFLKDFIDVDKVKIKKVEREKKHIDITLYLTDGTKVLIENKMKDYPKREQLEKYSQKNPDAHLKVLLVPFKINKSVLPSDWNIIHYSNIVEYLDLIKENKFTPFIEDYKELCINLEMLFNSVNPDPSTSTYGEVYELMKTVENLNLASAIERIYRNSLLDEISSEFKPYSGRRAYVFRWSCLAR